MYSVDTHPIDGPCSQIFQPTDPLTEETALDTLRTFVRVLLSSPSNDTDDATDVVVKTICSDSLEAIGKPEKEQAKASIKVLCTFIYEPCMSTLLSQWWVDDGN